MTHGPTKCRRPESLDELQEDPHRARASNLRVRGPRNNPSSTLRVTLPQLPAARSTASFPPRGCSRPHPGPGCGVPLTSAGSGRNLRARRGARVGRGVGLRGGVPARSRVHYRRVGTPGLGRPPVPRHGRARPSHRHPRRTRRRESIGSAASPFDLLGVCGSNGPSSQTRTRRTQHPASASPPASQPSHARTAIDASFHTTRYVGEPDITIGRRGSPRTCRRCAETSAS